MPSRRGQLPPLRVLAALGLVACLVGCTTASSGAASSVAVTPPRAPVVVQGAAPGEAGRVLDPAELPSVAPALHGPADVAFVEDMLHHHGQALFMVDLLDGRSDDRDLLLFAERLDVTQAAEIDVMERWLTDRDEEVPPWREVGWALGGGDTGGHGGHDAGGGGGGDGGDDATDMTMPGMLTTGQLEALAAAEGVEFERLWLEGMTRHHQGALAMIERLYAAGGGQEIELATLALHIEADQQIEIARMSELLDQR